MRLPPLIPFLANLFAAILILLPSCYGKVTTNADPITHGLELPLYTRNFVLSCNNSNGKPVDHWQKEGRELQTGDLEQLGLHVGQDKTSITIGHTRRHHEGNYTCLFDNNEKGELSVKARPEPLLESLHYVPGTTSLNLVEGLHLKLVCRSKLNESVSVTWQTQPEDLSDTPVEVPTETRENVHQVSAADKSIATLVISEAKYTDRAFYICRVDNGVASSDVTLLIRVKDKLAALWPFLAIVGEVIILCVVIFIYEKRRPKSGDFDEDVTISSKQTSPAKAVPDVRQRK